MHTVRILLTILACLPVATALAQDYPPEQICCVLEPGADIELINQQWGTSTLSAAPSGNLYLLRAEGVEDLESLAEQMTLDPAISAAGANYHIETPEAIRMMVVPAIGGTWEDYQDQSLTQRIGLAEAHEMSRGAGVVVAVLDTGIDPDHIAFEGIISPDGYDFIDEDDQPWETANGIDEDGDGTADEGFAHGTMVAGIVALVAPEATLLPIRVLNDEGLGTVYTVTRGILYAHEQGADVFNMSFGIPMTIPTMWPEIEMAADAGAILVSGAGNEDREEPPYYPGIDPRVFMVTALDSADAKADFASYHEEVFVGAPGVGVLSAYPGNEWGLGAGCSFAAPFVSGEAALILEMLPYYDPPHGGGEGEGEGEDEDDDEDGDDYERLEESICDSAFEIDDIPGNEAYEDMLGAGRIYLPDALRGLTMDVPADASIGMRLACFPNPSLGRVAFRLPAAGDAGSLERLMIFDATGRLVRSLAGEGGRQISWNGRDASGSRVPAGIYWARSSSAAGGESPVRLILLR
ncbi:MAG: S8 family serine peptidase [Candidatus Eisenbacteria bacterium]|nr:S8 family serine peptidase [Candidatus Eisenbacteria bacterium]